MGLKGARERSLKGERLRDFRQVDRERMREQGSGRRKRGKLGHRGGNYGVTQTPLKLQHLLLLAVGP